MFDTISETRDSDYDVLAADNEAIRIVQPATSGGVCGDCRSLIINPEFVFPEASMKRILISLALVLLTTFGVFELFKFTQRDPYVIEVFNRSNESLKSVQLMELGDFGKLGRVPAGESRRITLNKEQAKKPVYLVFVASDEIERFAGWRLTDKSHDGIRFHRLEIDSAHSVAVYHDRR